MTGKAATSLTMVEKPPAPKRDCLPKPNDEERVERDSAQLTSVWRRLQNVASVSRDLETLSNALTQAELLLDDDGETLLRARVGTITRKASKREIGNHMALLMVAYANSAKLEAGFGRLLCEDVGASEPSIGAVDWACRKLRRTWKPDFGRTAPSIAEILAEIQAAEERVKMADDCVDRLPSLVRDIRQRIERVRMSEESTKAAIRRALAWLAWNEARGSARENAFWGEASEDPGAEPPFEPFNRHWPERLVDQVRREQGTDC